MQTGGSGRNDLRHYELNDGKSLSYVHIPSVTLEKGGDNRGFSYNQSRAIRYLTVNDYSMEERSKKEEQMKKLKDDREMYSRWMEGDSNGTYI